MCSSVDPFYFLPSHSGMANMLRDFDWTGAGLGNPIHWSANLKAAFNIAMRSGTPIAIFWGAENHIIYNDAYSQILGDKHPGSFAKPARLVWEEVWPQLSTSFKSVTELKISIGPNEVMIPIKRVGYTEESYFDYFLSPIIGEDGDCEGIFNTVTESTYRVINERRAVIIHEMIQLLAGIDSIPDLYNVAIHKIETAIYDIPYALLFTKDAVQEEPSLQFAVHLPDALSTSINWSCFYNGEPSSPTKISPALLAGFVPESACWPEPFNEAFIIPLKNKNACWGYLIAGISPRQQADKSYLQFLESFATLISSGFSIASEKENEIRSQFDLQQRAADFRNLIMKAPIGIGIIQRGNFKIEHINDYLLSILGRSREEVLNKSLWSIINELNGSTYAETIQKALQTKSLFHEEEIRIELKNSFVPTVKYVDFTFQTLESVPGIEGQILLICSDSTEKVNNRLQIRATESRLLSILSETPIATAILTDRDMRVAMFNEPMLKIWRKDLSILGKPLLESLPELIGQPFPEILETVYNSGETYLAKEELAYLNRDGVATPGYFDYSFTAMRNTSGSVYGILVLANDVTESVLIKQKVEKSEQNFRNLIHNAPIAMCLLTGPKHTITIANQKMYELWGKKNEDVFQKSISEALPELSGQGFEEMLDSVYNSGQTISAIETPVTINYNGKPELVYVNFVYEPYKEPENQISGIMVVATDVSDHVHAKQQIEDVVASRTRELAEANLNLQNINSQLEQFAYIASHDLQEPVRKVSNFTQMLQHSLGSVDDKSQNLLNKISSSTTKMMALIRDVLSYSQLSKQKQSFEKVDLNEVIQNIIQDFEFSIEQKEAKIVVNRLPVIKAIPLQITQLFSNLLSNALKFTKAGRSPKISILATPLKEADIQFDGLTLDIDSYHLIEFRDNGIGFQQENAQQIFNIFQRLHGKAEYAGTGIGLALCKKIVQNHSGYIYALSANDEGSTFNIILPENPDEF